MIGTLRLENVVIFVQIILRFVLSRKTVFLVLLIIKISSDEFDVYPLAKMFLHFEIFTRSPTLYLGSLSLTTLFESTYVISLRSIGFVLLVP